MSYDNILPEAETLTPIYENDEDIKDLLKTHLQYIKNNIITANNENKNNIIYELPITMEFSNLNIIEGRTFFYGKIIELVRRKGYLVKTYKGKNGGLILNIRWIKNNREIMSKCNYIINNNSQ